MWPSAAIQFIFVFFRFPDTFGQLRTTWTNWSIQCRNLAATIEEFLIIWKEKVFKADRKKSLSRFNYWQATISSCIYSTMLVIRKIYIFLPLYFNSVFLLIMWSQPASMAWTVTSAAAFYCYWSYREHSVLLIRCVGHIWY